MASKPKGKSKLMNKLKKTAKGSWKRSREKAPQAKGSQLPGGIIRGVAQLSSYKFDEDKNGNPYFFLTGVVKEPEELAGCKASAQHFIKETQQKSVQDKLDGLSSDLQLLGAQLEGTNIDDIPGIIADLVKQKPHFLFNTVSFKDDQGERTYVFIQGLAEGWEDSDDDAESEDEEDDDGDDEDDVDTPDEEDDDDDGDDSDEDEGDGDEDDEEWEPKKKDVYLYKSTPKGKSKEVEIIGVNKKKETVTAKRIEDGKVFKNIGWDKLEGTD